MMYSYPSWGFPGFRKKYYPGANYYKSGYYNYNNYRINNNLNKSYNNLNKPSSTSNNSTLPSKSGHNDSTFNSREESPFSSFTQKENSKLDFSCDVDYYSDNECFNLFGLNLHIDDLIILALIFFLYNEGVDDIYLFIALFLLLIS